MQNIFKQIFTFRWKPTRDLAVVALSWVLVVGRHLQRHKHHTAWLQARL